MIGSLDDFLRLHCAIGPRWLRNSRVSTRGSRHDLILYEIRRWCRPHIRVTVVQNLAILLVTWPRWLDGVVLAEVGT